MSQENVEVVRRFYEAGDDMAASLELLDPGFQWWDRDDDPGATVHRGHDGFSKHMAELEADVEMQVEVSEFIDAGNHVVAAVLVHGRGRASGAPFEDHELHVLRLRDGKVTELREYRSRAEALEAAGLSEQDAHADS
jgi:ketosteroid isomerase-like protein